MSWLSVMRVNLLSTALEMFMSMSRKSTERPPETRQKNIIQDFQEIINNQRMGNQGCCSDPQDEDPSKESLVLKTNVKVLPREKQGPLPYQLPQPIYIRTQFESPDSLLVFKASEGKKNGFYVNFLQPNIPPLNLDLEKVPIFSQKNHQAIKRKLPFPPSNKFIKGDKSNQIQNLVNQLCAKKYLFVDPFFKRQYFSKMLYTRWSNVFPDYVLGKSVRNVQVKAHQFQANQTFVNFSIVLRGLAKFLPALLKSNICSEENLIGLHYVRVYPQLTEKKIIVDDFFPFDNQKRCLLLDIEGDDIWPLLIFKAWAKTHSSFLNVQNIYPDLILSQLTSFPTELLKIKTSETSNIFYSGKIKAVQARGNPVFLIANDSFRQATLKNLKARQCFILSFGPVKVTLRGEQVQLVGLQSSGQTQLLSQVDRQLHMEKLLIHFKISQQQLIHTSFIRFQELVQNFDYALIALSHFKLPPQLATFNAPELDYYRIVVSQNSHLSVRLVQGQESRFKGADIQIADVSRQKIMFDMEMHEYPICYEYGVLNDQHVFLPGEYLARVRVIWKQADQKQQKQQQIKPNSLCLAIQANIPLQVSRDDYSEQFNKAVINSVLKKNEGLQIEQLVKTDKLVHKLSWLCGTVYIVVKSEKGKSKANIKLLDSQNCQFAGKIEKSKKKSISYQVQISDSWRVVVVERINLSLECLIGSYKVEQV